MWGVANLYMVDSYHWLQFLFLALFGLLRKVQEITAYEYYSF